MKITFNLRFDTLINDQRNVDVYALHLPLDCIALSNGNTICNSNHFILLPITASNLSAQNYLDHYCNLLC